MNYNSILQIDDDADDCEMFADVLRQVSNSKYVAINNPFIAVTNLINGLLKPDVIVLDVNMPGMNGIEVLSKIKENQETSAIPVIMFSTSSRPELISRALELGAIKYVSKPNDIAELRRFIASDL